jgi:ATP-dependent Clp protease ATP-binding subunit ClpX
MFILRTGKKEVNLLIAGLDGHICDRCVEQAYAS